MRAYIAGPGVRSAAIVLAAAVLLTGCSGKEPPASGATTSPEPSSRAAEPPAEVVSEPEDTWADVEDPATMRVPLAMVEGVEDVRVWEGSLFRKNPTAVVVAGPADGGGVQTLTLGSSRVIGKETSEAEVRYWSRNSGLLEGRAKVLDPVVVDGLELQHARGRNEVEIVDGYLYADGEISYRVIFTTPLSYTEAQRDEAIGQVMATLELE